MKRAPRWMDCYKVAKPNFTRAHMSTNWKRVVFSDEKWNLDESDGYRHYWRDLKKERELSILQAQLQWWKPHGLGCVFWTPTCCFGVCLV
ncbi:unnamed protein product [Heligmosomoides polygyrus]|uniref:Neur_chan_LBD domain-containing protein n=1 Tax=Heligmosomoides polygyrus TaxID=6339 RepID=A0A183GBM4_HELPZ|nr:unnamed protein product [Heligmosomoides polygyrus]